jgi:basic membrane protein A and related proteins
MTNQSLKHALSSVLGNAAKNTLLSVSVLALAAACTTTAATPTPRSDYRIALVLNAGGTIFDGNFGQYAHDGATRASKDFGLTYNMRETREDAEYPSAIDDVVGQGHNIVVSVGFQMTDATLAAAEKYPDAYFIGLDQGAENPPDNYIGVQFREDQGGFLAGALAGMMTKSSTVAVVAGVQIPPVERFVNGFTNGAKYVNADVEVLSVYTSGFNNPDEGCARAAEFIEQGADVIFGAGGLTGSSAIGCASRENVYVIGVDKDEYRTTFLDGNSPGAEYILSSAVKRVDSGVYTVVSDILSGRFEGGNVVLGAADCGITYAPFHKADANVPNEVKTRLEAIWRTLAAGSLTTGVGNEPMPDSLAEGASPTVPDNAPQLSRCTG